MPWARLRPNIPWHPCAMTCRSFAPKVWSSESHIRAVTVWLERATPFAWRSSSYSRKIYAPLTAGLLQPVRGDRALAVDKRCELDRLYQRVCDDLNALLRA